MAAFLLSASLVGALPAGAQLSGRDCDNTSLGALPLTDLGSGEYQGFEGGLYPGGSNDIPPSHLEAGLEAAAAIQPLDAAGNPSPSGKIGLMSLGVSNTRQEFVTFIELVAESDTINPALVVVNGAQGGRDVDSWQPGGSPWQVAENRLQEAGITPPQVQAMWIKVPEVRLEGTFPDHARGYVDKLQLVLAEVQIRYPNVKVAYLSSRTYGGYGSTRNPEPFAYENGFGVKWTIEQQLEAAPGYTAGEKIPWIAWGPYLWADGVGDDGEEGGVPGRSDGLEWVCQDFVGDGIHPATTGRDKVAQMLWDHLSQDPTAKAWFLDTPPSTTTEGATPTETSPPTTETTLSPPTAPAPVVSTGQVVLAAVALAVIVGVTVGIVVVMRRRRLP